MNRSAGGENLAEMDSPFTVTSAKNGPGGSNSMPQSHDYFDLNSFFLDDFFPENLSYSDSLNMGAGGAKNMAMYADFGTASFPPIPTQNLLNDTSNPFNPYSNQAKKQVQLKTNKNDVIQIPPIMPRQRLEFISTSGANAYSNTQSENSKKGPKHSVDTMNKDTALKEANDSIEVEDNKRKREFRDLTQLTEEEQKVERRERNREHAKRSRIRKRLLLDSLQDQLAVVRDENVKLRRLVTDRLPPNLAQKVLMECTTEESILLNIDDVGDNENSSDSSSFQPSRLTFNIATNQPLLTSSIEALNNANAVYNAKSAAAAGKQTKVPPTRILMEPDYRLMESLMIAQQNFVLSDPSLPDNPIVYASDGFCQLSGYSRSEVVGRNCRFLQGPGTDQTAIDIIRQGVAEGRDISVCLLNYKADGTPFWNQFFVAPLKDDNGEIVNYVGVQCEVNVLPINEIKERVKKLPIPTNAYSAAELKDID